MSPLSRRAFLSASAAAGGLLLAGCSTGTGTGTGTGGAASGAARDVNYQLSWTHSVQFGGTYMADERGYFTDAGLNVTLSPGGPNVAGDANTVSGAALMNISGSDGVALSNESGADLVIVGAQYQKPAGVIMSLASNPLMEPKSLEGARIGVTDVNNIVMNAFIKINSLNRDAIEFVPSQYDPAMLVAGQVDGMFCFYTDLPVALEVQGIETASMFLADHGYNPMSQTYTVLRENLENERRADILNLLRGDIRGWQDYQADPDAAARLTVERFPDAGLDLDTQLLQGQRQVDIMYSDVTTNDGFGWFTDEQIARNVELFGILGIPGDASLFDRSLLEELYANGPRL